jgi:hypothetical protein
MLAKVCSAAVQGIEAYPVEVEVNVGWGDSSVVVIGLQHQSLEVGHCWLCLLPYAPERFGGSVSHFPTWQESPFTGHVSQRCGQNVIRGAGWPRLIESRVFLLQKPDQVRHNFTLGPF